MYVTPHEIRMSWVMRSPYHGEVRYASHHRRDRDVIKTILQHILTGVPVKEEKNDKEKKGENTMVKSSYTSFLQEIRGLIPQDRIYTDELRRLAWGTDAGFYRLSHKS